MNKTFIKQHAMEITMVTFSLIVYIAGLIVVADYLSWTLGIALGLIIALLKLKLMGNTLKKAISLSENKAKGYVQRQYVIRYLLTGAVLFIAALTEGISLLGVFFGLISMKIGAYVQMGIKKTE